MVYYRYEIVNDNIFKLSGEKSTEPIDGDLVVFCDEDIDLQLFDVTVGFIGNGTIGQQGEMLKRTKKIREPEAVSRKLESMEQKQAEYFIDIDFRVSMMELGL